MIRPEKYLTWLVLRGIPQLGNTRCKALIDHFRSPEAILNASEAELKATGIRLPGQLIRSIVHHRALVPEAEKELNLILRHDIRLVALTEDLYPPLLKEIPDPPPVLSYLGILDNGSPCLAVVGSRTATTYGRSTAENLAFRLASKGFQIVSGLARGIDSEAHQGALRAKGKTLAVLGSGLKKVYPRENQALFGAIAETGCILSEFNTFADPVPGHFPIRNRIIAGLSCGTIVVEAARRSGSLITARLAAEYNREVFAVPGSIQSRNSEGTHALLKQGARLVETETDIMDELHHLIHTGEKGPEPAGSAGRNTAGLSSRISAQAKYPIFPFLDPYPIHMDVLIEKSGLDSSAVSSQLFDLELEGRVIRHPGGCYSLSEKEH